MGHAVQIVHLDIKSSNILLTQQADRKIADVGIAKAMSTNECVDLTQVRRAHLKSL